MRCKTCDYPLWNLPARKCPECGTDFKPSDFHFVPNSVRFLCPHCEQCYYGTTPEGQLIPRTFNCVKCAQRIDMDEMLLFPAEGVQEQHTAADVMPWLQRTQVGLFKGWVRTIGMAMAAPNKLMRAIPLEGGLGEASFFMLATHALIALIGVCIPILFIQLLRSGGGVAGMNALEALGAVGGSLVGVPVGILVLATLWALLTHGLLKISGGTQRGIGRTMLAMYYSSGVNIVMIVPCIGPYCGGYFIWIWWMVSAILMVMEGQKVSGLRATLCVGAGPVLGVLAFVGYIVLIATIISGTVRSMGTVSGGNNYAPAAEVSAIHSSIMAYAAAHNGQGPAHAIELLPDSYATAANFAMWQIGHDEASVPLPNSNTSLDAFQYLPPNRMQMMAQSMAQGQPANLVAHRMGDVVFTYHGMNLSAVDPQLWIAIIDPDPDQVNSGPWPGMVSMAVLADGTGVPIRQNSPGMIQRQNTLRSQYGLPPLPDPSTVTNALPASGTASGGAPGPPPPP